MRQALFPSHNLLYALSHAPDRGDVRGWDVEQSTRWGTLIREIRVVCPCPGARFVGGLKERTVKEQMEKDSTEVLRQAVLRMLPRNRLRDVSTEHLSPESNEEGPKANGPRLLCLSLSND